MPVAVEGRVAVEKVGAVPTPAPCRYFPVAAVATLIALLVTIITPSYLDCFSLTDRLL